MSPAMKIAPRDAAEIVAVKRLSREQDARAIATGEKTREQVAQENNAFGFPRTSIDLKRVPRMY